MFWDSPEGNAAQVIIIATLVIMGAMAIADIWTWYKRKNRQIEMNRLIREDLAKQFMHQLEQQKKQKHPPA